MAMLGIMPVTGRCRHCGSNNAALYNIENHTLAFTCSDCSEYADADISSHTADFLAKSLNARFSSMDTDNVPESEVSLLFNKTAGFIENYYGFRFKSMDMLMISIASPDTKGSIESSGH